MWYSYYIKREAQGKPSLAKEKITIAREEDASWNLTGANPWILASSTDLQHEGPDFEAYCGQVARLRDAQQRLQREGLVIADPKGNPVPHPAIAIERAAQAEIRSWGAQFKPRRRR